jgi:hypothetical protein
MKFVKLIRADSVLPILKWFLSPHVSLIFRRAGRTAIAGELLD